MPRFPFLAAILFFLITTSTAPAITLAEIRANAKLTPERLIKYFSNFKFVLGRDLRKPEIFLANKAGDCDDFATLAADVLREKGYTTRLVVVFMPHDVHVVCYVKETNSYLDYNCRKKPSPLINCPNDLTAIATNVASSFRSSWMSASEFTMRPDGSRHFVMTEFR